MKPVDRLPLALAVLWLAAAGAPAVRAQPADDEAVGPVLQPQVSLALERDSNVLRAPQAAADQLAVLGAGLRLDKRWGLQRVTLDAQAREHRFRDFSQLDYRTLGYEAAWQARVTPWLQALLRAQRRQDRDVTDATPATAGVFRRTERDTLAQATWQAPGGWQLLAGASRRDSRSGDPRALEASPRVDSLRLGGGYETAAGARLQAWLRRGDGRYGDPTAPQFREREPTLALHWPATARTTLDLRLGHLAREHEADAASRDFEGAVGDARLVWRYSPKTRLEVGLARELGSYEFAGGGHVRGERLFLAPAWQASAKIGLRLRLARETRRWAVFSPASPDAGREDRLRAATLSLDWDPVRPLRVSASARREHRDANRDAYDYRVTLVSLGARLDF